MPLDAVDGAPRQPLAAAIARRVADKLFTAFAMMGQGS
jgi:hypothetical protein